MHRSSDVELNRIVEGLDAGDTLADVEAWIQELCGHPSLDSQFPPHSRATTPVVASLSYEGVVRAVEQVVATGASHALEEVERQSGLASSDVSEVCARALARKFNLSAILTRRGFRVIQLSAGCPFVDAAGRGDDGKLVFASREEKESVKNFLRTVRKADEDIRASIRPLVRDQNPDPATGVPADDPRLSVPSWVRIVPDQVFSPLLRFVAGGELEKRERQVKSMLAVHLVQEVFAHLVVTPPNFSSVAL